MKLWNKLSRSRFAIKLGSWEYWPFGILQLPIFFYYPWLALRARSLTFFTGSNPGIVMGGMFGESKYDVLQLIPDEHKPGTLHIKAGESSAQLLAMLASAQFTYPLIFKPDIGERGYQVERIDSDEEATTYLRRCGKDFLVQEFVNLPLEFGVFYVRYPDASDGKVISLVMKEMLTVTGDGVSELKDLILNNDRAKLQWPTLREKYRDSLHEIIPKGEKLEIVSIGNHCLGTKFINANHLINDRLNKSFDQIAKRIPGFYFGRFDLRCASIDDLQNGNVKIMELNGCGAEPAHIYDPTFSFWKAVCVLCEHWKTIYAIAEKNRERGVSFLPLKEAIRHYQNFKLKTR